MTARYTPGHREGKNKEREFTVDAPSPLLAYLLVTLSDKSRSTVKSILASRQVAVNGTVTTRFDAPLQPGDRVRVNMEKGATTLSLPEFEIVHEDDDLIVINKPHGLLSVATERERERTAYRALTDYARRTSPDGRVFVLHRLDRDTSGLMMFAKSERVQEIMQRGWDEMVTSRKYVAVVEGRPARDSDLVTSHLQENRAMNVYSSDEGKLAATRYTVLKTNGLYSLLELELETGRKNQIRVHVADIGHPVAGDAKYGARSNPIRRLALHARELHFIHPVTHREMHFRTDIPRRFSLLVKQRDRTKK
ncbi:MAG: RluA family pseudouridine synthase [Odoribacteraceae bacterium]|jgi:23S rRNA pseudouridine1911/1915/1917 synthase|nr:RluA family pseudouridine synthase [Odoribacteraceae bacterium]